MGVAGFFLPALVHLEEQAAAQRAATIETVAPIYAPGETR